MEKLISTMQTSPNIMRYQTWVQFSMSILIVKQIELDMVSSLVTSSPLEICLTILQQEMSLWLLKLKQKPLFSTVKKNAHISSYRKEEATFQNLNGRMILMNFSKNQKLRTDWRQERKLKSRIMKNLFLILTRDIDTSISSFFRVSILDLMLPFVPRLHNPFQLILMWQTKLLASCQKEILTRPVLLKY